MPSRERVLMPCNGGVCREGSLDLSDVQLRMVERAATSLPVERRAEFLQDVASRLGEGTPSTPAVEIAVGAALERTAVSLSDDGGMR